MESLDSNLPREGNFFGTQEIREYLSEAARWGKFLAIMGFIGIGLMVLAALFMMIGTSQLDSIPGMNFPMGAFGLIYVVIGALYFFPTYYLFQFSVKTREGLESQDSQELTHGFENLKSLFKFMGIFTIIILSLYALIILFAIIAAVL